MTLMPKFTFFCDLRETMLLMREVREADEMDGKRASVSNPNRINRTDLFISEVLTKSE